MGGHWRAVVREQLGQLRDCGLTRVLATHVGEGPGWLTEEAGRRGIDLLLALYRRLPPARRTGGDRTSVTG
jgi:hypothetical protein